MNLLTLLWGLMLGGCRAPQPNEPPSRPVRAAMELPGVRLAAETQPAAGEPVAAAARPGAGYDDEDGLVILEPSQGRPLILAPQDTFYFITRLPASLGQRLSIQMVHALVPHVRHRLQARTPMSIVNGRFGHLVLEVPASAQPGLYDLELAGEHASFRARRSLRIVERFKRRFRFVHLSDMNVGDLTAPEFDWTLPSEVNLLNPEFIVATGDYTQWGRLRDDPSGWKRALDYFAHFNAPVYMVCGDRDHEASFTRYVANSLTGTVDYGDYHGLLLLDHYGHRVGQDYDQLRWISQELAKNRNKVFNFIVTHNDELDLLDYWRELGEPAEFVRQYRVKMIICGGHVDWDGQEFAERLAGFEGLHYIRTHQSSTCMRDKASGTSHYRVIEVDGDQVQYVYPDDQAAGPGQHSIPAGRLRVFYSQVDAAGRIVGPAKNDGSESAILATVQNGLNQSFEDCRVWLRVAKSASGAGGGRAAGQTGPTTAPVGPAIGGGKLVGLLDGGSFWMCEIAVDLPDKTAVRVLASTDQPVPPPLPVAISVNGPRVLTFHKRQAGFGLVYYGSDDVVNVELTNQSSQPISPWPVVRLNGTQIEVDASALGRWPPLIGPGQTIVLPLRLTLGRLSRGPHLLQIYFLDDPLARLWTSPVVLRGG